MLSQRMGMAVALLAVCSAWGVTYMSQSEQLNSSQPMEFQTVDTGLVNEKDWMDIASKAILFDEQRRSLSDETANQNKAAKAEAGKGKQSEGSDSAQQAFQDWRLVAITADTTQRVLIELPDASFVSLALGDLTPDGRKISKIDARHIWLTGNDSVEQEAVNLFTFE
ncbi:hypothetical protein [Photobacterium rosenbergii]|uniref:hypothetical protein n=1 Tax=Photobacterium rosenbergii TaxID=294936 RepID=UPI001C9A1D1F|nr:hypothetical protein [Photobacterium rosenbergii]MBY5947381.1 hypothetical protein [Photobacterium rosenbergii]